MNRPIYKITFKMGVMIEKELVDFHTLSEYKKNDIFRRGYLSTRDGSNTIFYVDKNNKGLFEYDFPWRFDQFKQYMKLLKRSTTIKRILNENN